MPIVSNAGSVLLFILIGVQLFHEQLSRVGLMGEPGPKAFESGAKYLFARGYR